MKPLLFMFSFFICLIYSSGPISAAPYAERDTLLDYGELISCNPVFEAWSDAPKTIGYNKIWRRWPDPLAGPPHVTEYEFRSDTIIADKEYLRLYYEYEDEWIALNNYYREDNNGRVYYYVQNKEVLMYDFNLQVGDTISMPNSNDVNDESLYCTWEVFLRDTVTLENGTESVRIQLKNKENDVNMPVDEWIEGIGSTYRFFLSIYSCDVEYWFDQELQCCVENDVILYTHPDGSDCFYSSDEDIYQFNAVISPNPTNNGHVFIEGVEGQFDYQVYTLGGSKISEGRSVNGQIEILHKGVNIVRIFTADYVKSYKVFSY